MEFIAYINIVILVTIGLLHFYWAFGGRSGFMDSLPEENGEKIFIPNNKQTAIIATLFILLSVIHWCYNDILIFPFHETVGKYGVLVLVFVFGLRAIGDRKYVGFTKRIKGGEFAENDTLYFAPVCFLIAISNGLLFYFK